MFTTCGDRTVQIVGFQGFGNELASQTEAARASFRCTAPAGRAPSRSVAVEPRAGWHVEPGVVLRLTNGDAQLVLTARAANAVPAYASSFAVEGRGEQRGAYTIQHATATKGDGTKHPGAVVTWSCPARNVIGYAYARCRGACHCLDEAHSRLATTHRRAVVRMTLQRDACCRRIDRENSR